MFFAKLIFLQSFWYSTVVFGYQYEVVFFLSSILLALINFKVFRPKISFQNYIFVMIFFSIYGFVEEYIFSKTGLIKYTNGHFPLWLNSMYIVFLSYYGDSLNYISKLKVWMQSLIGGLGGLLAFYGGVALSPIEVLNNIYWPLIFISWAIFFPLSIKLFYGVDMWNKLLDASIFFSFDKSGHNRHKKSFNEKLDFFKRKNAFITGGTSGIGLAVAKELSAADINVIITGRNELKGREANDKLSLSKFLRLDMTDWKEVIALCGTIDSVDYLVLNAGGMPDKLIKNYYGVESQMASQFFGHYFLLRRLNELGKLNDGAKVVWVTSGGMYLKSLSLSSLKGSDEYDKVDVYANVKRAQVTSLDSLRDEFPKLNITMMHPGWVDTPAVREAIPDFFEKMKNRLRTPLEGGDTILWLLSENSKAKSGELYFDRKLVKKHLFWFTKKSNEKLSQLEKYMKDFYDSLVSAN